MRFPTQHTFLAILCTCQLLGCKSDEEKATEKRAEKMLDQAAKGQDAPPPEFDIAASETVVTKTLAPNTTYAEQGLGLEAKEGETFACVRYSIKNAGTAPARPSLPKLVDAKGTEHEVDQESAGKMPTDWKSSFSLQNIEPGAAQEGHRCYRVPEDAAGEGMKLHFNAVGFGEQGPWEKTIDAPAPAAAEGEANKADAGEDAKK